MTHTSAEQITEEIERKWLIDASHLREVHRELIRGEWRKHHIVQWYLEDGALRLLTSSLVQSPQRSVLYIGQHPQAWTCATPTWAHDVARGTDPGVVRLRSSQPAYEDHWERFLTIKGKGSIKRPEFEVQLPEEVFEILKGLPRQGNSITKQRFRQMHGGFVLELDVFNEQHEGLVLLEVEFKTEKEAEEYDLPSFMRCFDPQDVTNDPRYGNFSLAINDPLTI